VQAVVELGQEAGGRGIVADLDEQHGELFVSVLAVGFLNYVLFHVLLH
jgi:hypothetical protein